VLTQGCVFVAVPSRSCDHTQVHAPSPSLPNNIQYGAQSLQRGHHHLHPPKHIDNIVTRVKTLEVLTFRISMRPEAERLAERAAAETLLRQASMSQMLEIAQTSLVFDSTMTVLREGARRLDGKPDIEPGGHPSSPQGKTTPSKAPIRCSTQTVAGVKARGNSQQPIARDKARCTASRCMRDTPQVRVR